MVRWLTLESNPEAINAFLTKIGVRGVECVDIFSFEEEMLTFLPSPQVAILLCYPDYKKVKAIKKPEFDKLLAEGSGSFREWLNKAKELDMEGRSELLEGDENLASAHQATARAGETPENENTQHHFICYVAVDGQLYEIDSGAPLPRVLGASSGATLAADAGKQIMQLMQALDGSISVSALALVHKS